MRRRKSRFRTVLIAIATAISVWAQNGDKAGETQREVVPPDQIPPAPVLSPQEEAATFQVPPGFRVELVAAEPLIQSPVALQFDHQGRLWVVEMTGYMRNPEGEGEGEPVGQIVILTDTDGDGRMDTRTVFLDGLVMPRALMLLADGALVAEPPKVWFARDTNGDGRADEKVEVIHDYATQNDPKLGAKSNPEHASNGLMWALDNWIYSANHTKRYRWQGSPTNWLSDDTIFRGQWGLSQDDVGRLYHNSNSDPLRADLIPSAYLDRNPNLRSPVGANVQIEKDLRVWPARVNPGVNRGYQPGQLTPDGRLATFTGACGPVVYRGDQFGPEFVGDVFLCEPTANIIRRSRIINQGGLLTATNAYDRAEFLASTDERFRPVNLFNGPDGALYAVDFYRGLIQHRIYLTSYLRRQLASRELFQPVDRGRIWRIVKQDRPITRVDQLPPNPTTEQLLDRLGHPNGFWRDTAQRMLVERADLEAIPALKEMVRASAKVSARGRLQALWTLEGLRRLDLETLRVALDDSDGAIRSAALRLLEQFLNGPHREDAMNLIYRRAGFIPAEEQLQLLLTLGQMKTPTADAVTRALLMNSAPDTLRLSAALSGIGGRELEFAEALIGDPECNATRPGHVQLVSGLARCVVNEAQPARVERLLELAASKKPGDWQQLALLDGMIATLPPQPKPGQTASPVKAITFSTEPRALAALRELPTIEVRDRLARLEPLFVWPNKPGQTIAPATRPLTSDEEASFARGKELYPTICGACHQPHGRGQDGLAPPLLDSEWTLGNEARLIRIALHGLRDAVTVKGTTWNLAMPAFAEALNDQQVADVLTYVRREWGHTAPAVRAETVKAVREQNATREDSWTEAELLKF
ncbi:MAG TPA: c-type cytochrome [Verrucomicrobiota bacterium]|nr:dehydrogenase [Verrucomicrobiales bacterium]HRI15243.1 c-type cytochrome [Verrucomicrobiota bacterium]